MAGPAARRKRTRVAYSSDRDDDDDVAAAAADVDAQTPTCAALSVAESSRALISSFFCSSPISSSPSPAKKQKKAPARAVSRPRQKKPQKAAEAVEDDQGPQRVRAAGTVNAVGERGKTTDLLTLFSNQARKARTQPAAQRNTQPATQRNTQPAEQENHGQKGHMLRLIRATGGSDPISDEDDFADHKASAFSIVRNRAKKRLRLDDDDASATTAVSSTGTATRSAAGGQIFSKPARPCRPDTFAPTSLLPHPDDNGDDQRPWSERFGPASLPELAVHGKKVLDVRRWLEAVLAGRLPQRLLVLKGAAGTGKTTTLRLLARELGCQLLEWRNPSGSSVAAGSASARFQDFLGLGGRLGALETVSAASAAASSATAISSFYAAPVPTAILTSAAPTTQQPRQQGWGRCDKVLVLEEFPNTFTSSSSALASFRHAVLQFLANATPAPPSFGQQPPQLSPVLHASPIIPLVMVISETLLTSTFASSADSFTAHRLLGPDILRHPGTGLVEFNAIAPSLLAKALALVVQKESRRSGRRRTPGPAALQQLGAVGDIRNAIASLEFLCLKGDRDTDWSGDVVALAVSKPKRRAMADSRLSKAEHDSLVLMSQREASLGVFHAVGKVVYNKRDEPSTSVVPRTSTPSPPLAPYLAHHARPRPSQVAIDRLIDETGTDPHTFVSALHENYILSCAADDPLDTLDHVGACIGYLSDSDLLCRSSDVFFGGRRGSGGSGWVGRDAGSHVLRQDELAFHTAVRGLLFSLPYPVKRKAAARTDAYKMFYPSSLKLWRAKEELEAVADSWAGRLLRGTESHQDRNKATRPAVAAAAAVPPPALLGATARPELLLDRLPYMAVLCRARHPPTTPRLRDLDRLVAFRGIPPPDDEPDDDSAADDAPADGPRPRVRPGAGPRPAPMLKMILSDDDIEDD